MSSVSIKVACKQHPDIGVIGCEACEELHSGFEELINIVVKELPESEFDAEISINGEKRV